MSSERRRLVLLGLGPTAAAAYAGLRDRFEVAALVRPDPTAADELVAAAGADGVEVSADPSPAAVDALVARVGPDAVVVSSYDRILPVALLGRCPFVNVHYAPLPRYRGRANVNWMIANGEPDAAISIHVIVPGLDAGGILYQQTVPIGPRDTVADVYRRLDAVQQDELAGAIERHLGGDSGSTQDESRATYGCTRLPEDGEIDWAAPTAVIDRLIRAVTAPYPGAFTYLGLQVLAVWAAAPVVDAPSYEGRVPGRVVRVDRRSGTVDVLTGDGVLRLERVAVEGGPERAAAELVSSVRATLGLRTIDLVRRIHDLEARLDELSH
jgi:methionyl-tRNA formyltransferase